MEVRYSEVELRKTGGGQRMYRAPATSPTLSCWGVDRRTARARACSGRARAGSGRERRAQRRFDRKGHVKLRPRRLLWVSSRIFEPIRMTDVISTSAVEGRTAGGGAGSHSGSI